MSMERGNALEPCAVREEDLTDINRFARTPLAWSLVYGSTSMGTFLHTSSTAQSTLSFSFFILSPFLRPCASPSRT